MRIELPQNPAEPAELSAKWQRTDAQELFDELKLVGELRAKALFSPEGKGKFLLTGSLSGTQRLTCARTLEPFDHPFETQMVLEVEQVQVSSQELDDDDEEVFSYRIPVAQDFVDVSECVRQLVILQEPMYPVKNPGEAFEWSTSKSEEPAEDPRWAKLKALRREMNQSEQE